MEAKLTGNFNNDVITELNIPEVVDVSTNDYEAKKFNDFGEEDGPGAEQRHFIIAETEDVTLKVETRLGTIITWNFSAGPYPMPLKRIIADQVNTKTTIQIAY